MESAAVRVVLITDKNLLQLALDIRKKVFGGEQNVPDEINFDAHDAQARHFLAMDAQGRACGTARWRRTPEGNAKLERFAVLAESRRSGAGAALVHAVVADVPPGMKIYLHAQIQVVGFYEKLGFRKEGDSFTEADIVHYKMVYRK